MRKTYQILDLDCADCAAKIEKSIQKIPGVKNASVGFLTRRLVIEADEADFEEILKKARKAARKVEPDCSIAN